MTEKSAPDEGHRQPTLKEIAESTNSLSIQPATEVQDVSPVPAPPTPTDVGAGESFGTPLQKTASLVSDYHTIFFW